MSRSATSCQPKPLADVLQSCCSCPCSHSLTSALLAQSSVRSSCQQQSPAAFLRFLSKDHLLQTTRGQQTPALPALSTAPGMHDKALAGSRRAGHPLASLLAGAELQTHPSSPPCSLGSRSTTPSPGEHRAEDSEMIVATEIDQLRGPTCIPWTHTQPHNHPITHGDSRAQGHGHISAQQHSPSKGSFHLPSSSSISAAPLPSEACQPQPARGCCNPQLRLQKPAQPR